MPQGITTKGRDELLARVDRLSAQDTVGVRIGYKATQGSVKRVRFGRTSEDVSRSAGQNVIVLRSQAKLGRVFAFVSDAEARSIHDVWRGACATAMRTLGSSVDLLTAAAQQVGMLIIAAYRSHLESGQGQGGPQRPVKPGVQKQKDREVGPGLPPLVRTGQLIRGLIIEGVRRI